MQVLRRRIMVPLGRLTAWASLDNPPDDWGQNSDIRSTLWNMIITAREWVGAVAATIRAERTARRWKQADLADRVGLSRSTVLRFESEQRVPDVEQLAILADAFGMTLAELLAASERRLRSDHTE